jgi:murein hydrolase activator
MRSRRSSLRAAVLAPLVVLPVLLGGAGLVAHATPAQPVLPGQGAAQASYDTGLDFPAPKSLEESERVLTAIDQRVGELEQRVQLLSESAGMREQRALARGRAYAKMARVGLLAASGGFDQFVSHAMKVEGTRRALVADLDAAKQMRQDIAGAGRARAALLSKRAPIAAQREVLAQAAALVAEAEDRKASFERAFAKSEGSGHIAVYGAGITVHDDDVQTGFLAMKGRLPLPVTGKSSITTRKARGGVVLELHAPAGAPARATFDGRVAFSSRYGEYGTMVILDHGDRWFTVTGNLGSVDVRVGDEVSAGSKIGTVGDEGSGPMVSFELRHGGDTLDPRPFVGL